MNVIHEQHGFETLLVLNHSADIHVFESKHKAVKENFRCAAHLGSMNQQNKKR